MSAQRAYSPTKERKKRPTRSKRSSVMRPVLRLELQSSTPDDRPEFKRCMSQRNVARLSSNDYDHLRPARRSKSSNSLLKTDTFDKRSSDKSGRSDCQSMVLVQHIDNGQYHLKTFSASISAAVADDDSDDYDHLFPNGEYEHLCDCTYARVEAEEEDEEVWMEPPFPPPPQSFGSDLPCGDGSGWNAAEQPHPLPGAMHHRRAKSIDLLTTNRATGYGEAVKRRQVHSISDTEHVSHWSLGENVMKTLTESGLQLFNIEHPTHESEKEVHRTWPKLRSKLEQWRQSQHIVQGTSDGTCVARPKEGSTSLTGGGSTALPKGCSTALPKGGSTALPGGGSGIADTCKLPERHF